MTKDQTYSITGRVRETPLQPKTDTRTGRVRDIPLPTDDGTQDVYEKLPTRLGREKLQHRACKKGSAPDERQVTARGVTDKLPNRFSMRQIPTRVVQ